MKLALLLLIAMSQASIAADYAPLSGEYALGGKTLYDLPADERRDTHMYFELTGSAAKDMYTSMKVAARRDACGEPGTLTKRMGAMQCTQSSAGRQYHCWFGIDLKNQRIVNAVIC